VLQAQGDLSGALEAYQAGLNIGEPLAALDARNTEWQRDLSLSHDRIGEVLQAQGDFVGATAAHERGVGDNRAPGRTRSNERHVAS